MYAREIAQMKARLVEKDAELLGGFGSPAKLIDTQWSVPPMTPLQINPRPDAAFLERHFGFDSYPGAQSQKPGQVDRWRSLQCHCPGEHVSLMLIQSYKTPSLDCC